MWVLFLNKGEDAAGGSGIGSRWPLTMPISISIALFSAHGRCRVITSHASTPNDHTSDGSPWWSPSSCSGEDHAGVPAVPLVNVLVSAVSALEVPKSASIHRCGAVPCRAPLPSTLRGFKSLQAAVTCVLVQASA